MGIMTDFVQNLRGIGADVLENHSDGNKCYIIYRYGKYYNIVIFKGSKMYTKKYKTCKNYENYGLLWLVNNF